MVDDSGSSSMSMGGDSGYSSTSMGDDSDAETSVFSTLPSIIRDVVFFEMYQILFYAFDLKIGLIRKHSHVGFLHVKTCVLISPWQNMCLPMRQVAPRENVCSPMWEACGEGTVHQQGEY